MIFGERVKIFFFGNMACYLSRQMHLCAEQHIMTFLDESATDAEIASHCQNTDILVSMVFDQRFVTSSLKKVLVPGIGVDKINFSQLPENVEVLTCAAHEMAVSEYILSYVISYFRELDSIGARFKSSYDWRDCSRLGGVARKQLNELTVGVIGGGRIGRKVIEVFSFFGSSCRCLTRYPYETSGSVLFFPRTERDDFLRGCDVVIVACGVDKDTQNIIDQHAITMMEPDTLLINIARAECVSYEALAAACRDRKIGRAVIDVWQFYPQKGDQATRPSAADFRQLDNVDMTPHISAWTRKVIADRAAILARYINEESCNSAEYVLQENQA